MKKIRTIWMVLPLCLVVCLFAGAAFFLMSEKKESAGNDGAARIYEETQYTEYPEKWQEGTVTYKGKDYTYNSGNKIFLIMGIDKDERVKIKKGAGSGGGRADAIFLLIQNKKENTLSVVSVNRNTMTRVAVYSEKGKKIGYYTLQICLQHAYGDGGKSSCTRSVEAVSYLFRDLPISGYIAMNMAGIQILNDAVGGVPVQITEDMCRDLPQMGLVQGQEKVLWGDDAENFLRERDQQVFDSATSRLRRQEEYLKGLFQRIRMAISGNGERAAKIYEALEKYTVTNLDFRSVLAEWKDCVYDPDKLQTVPGKTVMGDEFEEFYVDNDRFRQMIMDLFYRRL